MTTLFLRGSPLQIKRLATMALTIPEIEEVMVGRDQPDELRTDRVEGLFIACSCATPRSSEVPEDHEMSCFCRMVARIIKGDIG